MIGCKILGTKTCNDVSMLVAGGWRPGGVWRPNDDFYELAGVDPDSLVENLLIINLIILGLVGYICTGSSDSTQTRLATPRNFQDFRKRNAKSCHNYGSLTFKVFRHYQI